MKTEISQFCAVCAESIGMLPSALQKAAEQCEHAGPILQEPLRVLNEVRAGLRSLTDKLRSQQAYLLIFGPLKSGKSTLMNAISGAYVSEVTSLPGYPCLVFVQHGHKPQYSVTRYNGRESVFSDTHTLNGAVLDAHHALAQQIRAAEERGEPFDPRSTFPEAIRRIDIKLPVDTLAESSTVLVDTPGLYSRMNFGYDVLTREFRDSAACAVFVVKTDNLFLEQVFAEFNQLLGLFSRIFIVVNVDSSKRDLAPDGSLQPSAESRDPSTVLQAFTTLSMAGPLREAYDAGRVRIHAVDLLGAAAEFLSGAPVETTHRPAFDAFLRDLTEYLNSSDYTREFVRDSLRQAQNLCNEAREAATGPQVHKLRDHQDSLQGEMRDLDARLAAADRLFAVDWAALFQPLQADHARGGEEDVRLRTAQVREDLRQGLKRWFSGNDSLAALSQLHLNPTLTDAARALGEQAKDRLQRLATKPHGGVQPSVEVLADLQTAGFSPAAAGQRALVMVTGADDVNAYKMTIPAEALPVRKTFVDWILFRSVASVRRRLFGEDLTKEIPAEEKNRRIREESRAEIERLIEKAIQERFPAFPAKYGTELASTYAKRAVDEIMTSLRALREHLNRERGARQDPFVRQARILSALEDLAAQSERVCGDLELLEQQENAKLAPAPEPAAAEETAPAATTDSELIPFIPQVTPLPLLD